MFGKRKLPSVVTCPHNDVPLERKLRYAFTAFGDVITQVLVGQNSAGTATVGLGPIPPRDGSVIDSTIAAGERVHGERIAIATDQETRAGASIMAADDTGVFFRNQWRMAVHAVCAYNLRDIVVYFDEHPGADQGGAAHRLADAITKSGVLLMRAVRASEQMHQVDPLGDTTELDFAERFGELWHEWALRQQKEE